MHLRGREARIKPRLAAQVWALLLGHSARIQYCPDDPPGAEGTSRVLGDGGRHHCLEMGCTEQLFLGGGWDLGKEKLLGGVQSVNRGAGGKTAARLLLRVG